MFKAIRQAWREMFPSYHEREQRRMARARVARLRRFGVGRERPR